MELAIKTPIEMNREQELTYMIAEAKAVLGDCMSSERAARIQEDIKEMRAELAEIRKNKS